MAPLNIQPQWINEQGEIVEKDILTHDQSLEWEKSGSSINSRTDTSQLQQCKFGKCLSRLINWAVPARKKYPNRQIMTKKDDFKSAYRRLHLHSETALRAATQLPELKLAMISLRLTFGGSLGLYEWSVISEMVCNLTTAIKHNDNWDPLTLFGINQHIVPSPKFLDDLIPFAKGLDLIVEIDIDPRGTTEDYTDDLVSLAVDGVGMDNIVRCDRASLLAFDTCSRSLHENEPIPRETMEARNKLKSEALLKEQKIILGWLIDFRRLLIHLPENKYVAWTEAIKKMISVKASTAKEIEANIGRLVHLGLAILSVHHFMSRLRDLHTTAKRRRSVKINCECLKIAKDGISLNSIAFRRPTHIYRSDSCPAGLGGYSNKGWAWRWYLPKNLLFRASNNLLEHLAAIVSPWVDILAGRLKKQDCVLSMTDSTTAEGWLKKSNFNELGESPIQVSARIKACQMQATLFMSLGIKCYSQWFPGERNQVSDAFSCDDDRSDKELTSVIKSFCPLQVPSHFEILQLRNEIISWLTALLLKLPVSAQLSKVHTRSKIGRGGVGMNMPAQLESKKISSSKTSPESTNTSLSARLPWLSGKQDFQEHLMNDWLQAQSKIPCSMDA
jgi:hypothetical protein